MPEEEKGAKKKHREYHTAKLIPSLALSIFGSIGLALLLGISGTIEGDVAFVWKYLCSGFVFVVVAWVWLFSGVFIGTKLVESSSSPRIPVEYLLVGSSFLAVLVSGILCAYRIFGSCSWWWLMMVIGLGGICGVAHGWFLYFQRTRKSIDSRLANVDRKIFVKSLELEHSYLRSYFQQVATTALIFITAVVGGYYIRIGQTDATILINTSLMVTWFIIGILFGITTPIVKHMEYIRRVVRIMATPKPKKQ